MARDWESWLRNAARPASAAEEQQRDRTEGRIRWAIQASAELPTSVRVYTKGSYANNTNVRRDADVDIAVEWTEQIKVYTWGDTEGLGPNQLGYDPVKDMISPVEFRSRVERALTSFIGASHVDTTGNKAIGVAAGASTLDADVVPCFLLHRYDEPRADGYVEGHRIYPKNGGYVDNYPKQHYDNGVSKNSATRGRFKDMVRCAKRLEGELFENGMLAKEYPSYLVECLVYNVTNDRFGHPLLFDDMEAVFDFLWDGLRDPGTYNSWTEVNGLMMLFRGRPDRVPANAFTLVDRAWRYLKDA